MCKQFMISPTAATDTSPKRRNVIAHQHTLLAATCVIAMAALALNGCERGRRQLGQVAGQVTFEGHPVAGEVIVESVSEPVSAVARIDASGNFEFQSAEEAGLPLGHYRVAIRPARVPIETGKPLPSPPKAAQIPNQYWDFATSGLSLDVVSGVNSVQFPLHK
jgi:hypothetical protein